MTTPRGRLTAREWAREFLKLDYGLVIDTETTGVRSGAEIIQIAIVGQEGELVFDSLVRPKSPIPLEATESNGITDEMVADAPTWPEIYPDVKYWLNDSYVVAYNAAFDSRLIRQTNALYELDGVNVRGWDCAMLKYAQFEGTWNAKQKGYKWHKLAAACIHLRVDIAGPHDAKRDALATWGLIQAMAAWEPRK